MLTLKWQGVRKGTGKARLQERQNSSVRGKKQGQELQLLSIKARGMRNLNLK